uniref:Uncharacterized protein n=2 Tax=Timema TaxID=61471 RepID=A0A7R9JSF2_TIMGE|nr:unnamed protein product [Timema genevievae]
MSKYSSDSDSSRRSERYRKRKGSDRTRGRSRSISGSSSDSNYSYKKKSRRRKHGKGHRSRSRDKYTKSRRHHLKVSDDRSHSSLRSRSGSKGHSRARRSSKERSRSQSKSRVRSRSSSKERKRLKSARKSRSRSGSYSRGASQSTSPSPPKRRSPSKSSPEPQHRNSKQNLNTEEQLMEKLQKAIRAAQSADNQLRQQGLLAGAPVRPEDTERDVMQASHRSNLIDEINDAKQFVPKNFSSSKTSRHQTSDMPVIVDLTLEATNLDGQKSQNANNLESIFHTNSALVSFLCTCTACATHPLYCLDRSTTMFSKPSVMIYPLYSAPKKTPVSIGSRDGHYLSNLHAPMGSPYFSHWTRPGSSGGAILFNPLSLPSPYLPPRLTLPELPFVPPRLTLPKLPSVPPRLSLPELPSIPPRHVAGTSFCCRNILLLMFHRDSHCQNILLFHRD